MSRRLYPKYKLKDVYVFQSLGYVLWALTFYIWFFQTLSFLTVLLPLLIIL